MLVGGNISFGSGMIRAADSPLRQRAALLPDTFLKTVVHSHGQGMAQAVGGLGEGYLEMEAARGALGLGLT